MRDYMPEEEFTLEDILREFGSGPDTPPPEPVLPGMPEAFPELPEVPELPDNSIEAEAEPEEVPAEAVQDAPEPEKRPKRKSVRKHPQPKAVISEDPYEDDFEALEGQDED